MMKKFAALLLALMLCACTALAEMNTQATLADYLGRWCATHVDLMGMQFSLEEMGMSMEVIVAEDGTAIIINGTGDEAESTVCTAKLENGALRLTTSVNPEGMLLQLLTDGAMTYTEVMDDGASTCIRFEKAK